MADASIGTLVPRQVDCERNIFFRLRLTHGGREFVSYVSTRIIVIIASPQSSLCIQSWLEDRAIPENFVVSRTANKSSKTSPNRIIFFYIRSELSNDSLLTFRVEELDSPRAKFDNLSIFQSWLHVKEWMHCFNKPVASRSIGRGFLIATSSDFANGMAGTERSKIVDEDYRK